MRLLGFLFASKKNDSPDVLGVYPEYMQVRALPERRYLKTARFLAVIILINMALIMAVAGFYAYIADRVDVSIANRRVVNLYTIDSVRNTIIPAEYEDKSVLAINLYTEAQLLDYIRNRHEIVWDNTEMQNRWGTSGPIAVFSNYKTVYTPFRVDADLQFGDSRSQNFVRDIHIYNLQRIHGNVWEGLFDMFDMPIPDSYNPLCPCTDNSPACIKCKKEHTSRHRRFRAMIRVNFNGKKSIQNPLGLQVVNYSILYIPVKEEEKYWGIPSDLKPDL